VEYSVGVRWVAREAAKNLLMRSKFLAYLRKRTYSRQNLPSTCVGSYFDVQWQTYCRALADLDLSIDGASILELGSGPILANGVRFIAAGAASYTGLDRFDLLRRDQGVIRSYRELIGTFPEVQRQRCRGLVLDGAETSTGKLFDPRIQTLVAKIEDVSAQVGTRRWDIILSFDVLEHVDDPAAALRSIRNLLSPAGVMIHRVDVGAHNMPPHVHRLAHLTFSDRMWDMITSQRAICNRYRPSEFRSIADALGFETLRFEPTTLLAPDEVAPMRTRLWKRFAHSSFEDLAILDFLWAAKLPA
jgi:SAM-dependent methyltransferase